MPGDRGDRSSTIGAAAGFYVTGGTLRPDAPSYVARQADIDLYDGLTRGEFCYVLTSRQMGKSSLMARTAQRFREDGVAVTVRLWRAAAFAETDAPDRAAGRWSP